MHKTVFCATKTRQRRVLSLESRECPDGAKLKDVDWNNRGFSHIKSLKWHHLSSYRSPPLAAATGLWPGIHMFLRERISRYSSEVSGVGREDRSRNGALRTYASVCSTLEPLENRWTILRIRVRDATYRVFPGSRAESLFYDCDVLSRPKADLQSKLCTPHVAPRYRRRIGYHCMHWFIKDTSYFDFWYSMP